MIFIEKIKLKNFKRFKSFEAKFNSGTNILIGINETGKSTILEAISLVLSGSGSKVESIGLERLFNTDVIQDFLNSDRRYENLPTLQVELYLNNNSTVDQLEGLNNSDGRMCSGMKLSVEPNGELGGDINEILMSGEGVFPFELYTWKFTTFSGEMYSGYKKYIKYILVDNSQISSEQAIRQYVKDIYLASTESVDRVLKLNKYRVHKENFKREVLDELNRDGGDYHFSLKNNSKSNLETDLTLTHNNVDLENKGKGEQTYIKTKFALKRSSEEVSLLLLEEPENHLSFIKMRNLINELCAANNRQLILSTHSNLICTRLNLKKCILLSEQGTNGVLLDDIEEDDAKFFMKAPNNSILELILSKKVILVEGSSEYILMERFFNVATGMTLEESDVNIVSVNGISFKRYLSITKKLKIKTAVITDNDGDSVGCLGSYNDYLSRNIKVFTESNNTTSTFERCIYALNKDICDDLFQIGNGERDVQKYMLNNKTESAYKLLLNLDVTFSIPDYIKAAIRWINE